MHKTLICLEKNDFHRLVDRAREYADGDLNKCYVFNRKGYTAEIYKEKVVNGIDCVIFGWNNYNLNLRWLEEGKSGNDLTALIFELGRVSKKGYILMEFENNMLVNLKNQSKIKALSQSINLDKICEENFSKIYNDEKEKEKNEEEEYEE